MEKDISKSESRSETMKFLLLPSPAQRAQLTLTVETFNRASQYVAELSHELDMINKVAIQPLVYRDLRKKFGLPSQMAVRAISSGIEARKQDSAGTWRKRGSRRLGATAIPKPAIPMHAPVAYDQLMMSFPSIHTLSMLCLGGREYVPIRFLCYDSPRHESGPIRADLVADANDNVFYFYYHIPSAARK